MKKFLFMILALTLAVACGGGDNKKQDESLDDGLGANGRYEVGDYYNRDGKEGVVIQSQCGGKHGKIISLDETEMRWCTIEQFDKGIEIGLRNDVCGMENTAVIMAREDRECYPAAMWCANKGEGWYLPTVAELRYVQDHIYKINETLARHDAPKLSASYWTSVESDAEQVFFVILDEEIGPGSFPLYKNYNQGVRAVARF